MKFSLDKVTFSRLINFCKILIFLLFLHEIVIEMFVCGIELFMNRVYFIEIELIH